MRPARPKSALRLLAGSSSLLLVLWLSSLFAATVQAQSSSVIYGTGCGGALPAPTISFTGSNVPGEYAAVHLAGAPAGAFVVMQIGFSDTTSNFGPLPVDVSGVPGVAPGCFLRNSSEIRVIANANPDGTLKFGFKVPAALGSDLFFQWAVVEQLEPLLITFSPGLQLSIFTDSLMHVVILAPQTVVDYDGNGSEPVLLDGTGSHTHDPQAQLTAWEWSEAGTPLGSGEIVTAELGLGPHLVTLEIADDDLPPDTLLDSHALSVVPASAVPGVLARYYDASQAVGGPASLLGAVPVNADYSEVLSELAVEGGGSVGGSPFTGEVLVVLKAQVALPVTDTWTFSLSGGSEHRLYVDGLLVPGPAPTPLLLAAGAHAVEARFAVATLGQLPLLVSLAQGAGPATPIPGALLTHNAGAAGPVINLLTPAAGTADGGNSVVLDGTGFFPAAAVTVHWGASALTLADGLSITPERIEFLSPPHAVGNLSVSVETPAGTSNSKSFSYVSGGPVPVNFTRVLLERSPSPTSADWGPDGRLYVTSLSGELRAYSFDEDWNLLGVDVYPGVSNLPNSDSLGLAFNPFDPPSPVRVYVSHAKLYADGGGALSGPSTYWGAVSVLTGPDFDAPQPLVTGLAQSNSGHAVNGLAFDDNGDLLIAVGCNTNAGVAYITMGMLPESPLSGAILKAETSRPDFQGAVSYVHEVSGLPDQDQRQGEEVLVAPGSHLSVQASGLRNPYDLVYTTSRRLYASDNGPNTNYGPASTGPSSTGPPPEQPDEILLIEADNYYGSANRARGAADPRQDVYYDTVAPSQPSVFTQALLVLPSSQDGITEYRAATFGGQMLGELLVQRWQAGATRLKLAPAGRAIVSATPVLPVTGALDLVQGPGGALVAIDQFHSELEVLAPVNSSGGSAMAVLDLFPWRAPMSGGVPFVLGGRGFGTLLDTAVFFDGQQAALTAVSPQRIEGLLPALLVPDDALVDVLVVSAGQANSLPKAFRPLMPQPGSAPGFWGGGDSSGGGELPKTLPFPLPHAAGAVIQGQLLVVGGHASGVLGGLGQPGTFSLALPQLDGSSANGTDALGGSPAPGADWILRAERPFPGAAHAAVALPDGRLALIGGFGGGSEGRLQFYNPQSNQWTLGANLPWAGGGVAATVIGGRIFAAGGLIGSPAGPATSAAAVYDIQTGLWSPLPALPAPRAFAAAGTEGAAPGSAVAGSGKFWIFGGRSGTTPALGASQDVQVYNPANGLWDWSEVPFSSLSSLPSARSGSAQALWWRGEFYLVGGEASLNQGPGGAGGGAQPALHARVDVLNPLTGVWRLEAELPTPRTGCAFALYQGRYFVVGGAELQAGGTLLPSTAVEVFTRQ
ncbi:MAG: IPT/TIG domain-containing protein [Planctomycetota bacterium]